MYLKSVYYILCTYIFTYIRVHIIGRYGHSNNSFYYFFSLLIFAKLYHFVVMLMLPHWSYGPSDILPYLRMFSQ